MSDRPHNQHSVQIEREKTKRTYAYLIVAAVLGLVAIVLFYMNVDNGSLKVTTDGIEVTIEQPLIQQVSSETQTISVDGDTVSMTTGTVPDSVVEKIQADRSMKLKNDEFVGKNLIDRSQGFVVSTDRPDLWSVDRSAFRSRTTAVLSMTTTEGSRLVVDTIPTRQCVDLACVIKTVSRTAATTPTVEKDERTSTAVVTFADNRNQTVIVKCVRQDEHWVTVRGQIAQDATPAERKDVIKTVTTFSLISKK